MKVKLKLGVVVVASAAALLTALAYSWVQTEANSQAEQQIRKVEEERRQAILRNDIKDLDSLMAPEYTAIFQLFGGRVHTKAEELALNESDARKVQSWDPTEVTIRVYDQVGLVTGLAEIVDVLQGNRRHIRVRYTHMWVKRNGKWQLAHRHTTRVATIEGPAPPGAATGVPSSAITGSNPPTKEDVEKEIRRRWDVFNSGNLDEILKNDMGGFGFGWRTAAPRSVAGFGGVDARDVAARGSEALRVPIKQFLDSMEHYHATLDELHTAVDGEIGLAWGILTEDFKLKGQPPEKARVRFTQALKKEEEHWRPLLDHRDIQPFDEHGRYLTQFTSANNTAPGQTQPAHQAIIENLLRNNRVHVARITHAPHQHVRMHYAPPLTLVFLTDAHFAWVWPDGNREEVSYKAGDAAWFPGGLHASESLDDHEERMMLVVPIDDPDPARSEGDPFIGTFKPTNCPVTVSFSREGEWLIANVSNDESGDEYTNFTYRAKFDGKEYSIVSPPNLTNTISLERRTRNVIVQTERLNGRVFSIDTYVLSTDGRSLDHERLKIDSSGQETTRIETLWRQ